MVRFMKSLWLAGMVACLGLATAGCEGEKGSSKGTPDKKAMEQKEEQKKKALQEKMGEETKAIKGDANKEKGKADDKSKGESKKEK